MITKRRFRSFLNLTLAAVLLLSACSFGSQTEDSKSGSPGTVAISDSSRTTDLECEIEGYPCTYDEVDPRVLEESFTALDEAVKLVEEGDDIQSAVDYLESRQDVVEILSEPEGIRFRLKNGPPLWVVNAAAVTAGSKAPGAGENTSINLVLGPPSPNYQSGGGDDGPIGESERGEEPYKKALLLSPFFWDFDGDETDVVKFYLEKSHRNYSCDNCEVVVKKNSVPEKEYEESDEAYEFLKTLNINFGVTLDDFKSWNDYDLIHLSTHGIQICENIICVGMLMTGMFIDVGDYKSALEVFSPEPGVAWGKMAVPGCGLLDKTIKDKETSAQQREEAVIKWSNKGCGAFPNRYWQLVTPDFFEYHYQNSNNTLNEKMIFLSACESMKDLTLAKALAGENTTVYGWTESVNAGGGATAAIKFYEHYIRDGLRAEIAYEKVKDRLINDEDNPVLARYKPKGISIESILPPELLQQGEENTRGREIITLMQPIYRVELQEKDAIPTNGGAGDGKNDKLLFLVQIDGIDESQNPDDFVIHLAVDGEELEETFTPQEKISDYSYWTLDEVELPFDASERDYIELEAWVELPTGGFSRHVLEEIELANCGWTGNMSGSKSGELKGDIVFPSTNLTSVNIEELALLAEGGYLGPDTGSGLPSASDFTNLPFNAMLGNRSQFPFMMLIPGQGGTVMLDTSSFGAGKEVSFDLLENSEERFEGSFSILVNDIASQSGYSVEGEMIWHVDSICSMDVILELAANPLPAGLIE